MTRIGFAYNPTKPAAMEMTERSMAWCRDHGVDAWAEESDAKERLVANLQQSDYLVVLGGDGTFLRAARALAEVDVPVLGVNSGRIGFLAKVDPEGLVQLLADLVAQNFEIEARMLLEARLIRASGEPAGAFAALNDAAIVRGAEARVLHLDVSIDDTHLASYIADGVIVATPTGSTAYSFSAGGPILDPTARNLIVTPVAAYLSSLRSIVVGSTHTVRVRHVDGAPGIVSIDGRDDYPVNIGDTVEVRALPRSIRFIEPVGALPFWDLLRQKAALLPA